MGGEINGFFIKQFMSAMLTSEYSFPELSKKVSELKENKWYPLQMFSDMLFEIAEKMSPLVMVKIGKNLLLAAQETLLKFGFDTFDKLGKDISSTLTGIVRKVDLSKIQKTIKFSSNNAILAYSIILPVPYVEGNIRGAAQLYKKVITTFEVKEEGPYNIFTIEWL